MPLADPRNVGRGEQAYGQSPSGPGPYAPQMQGQVPGLAELLGQLLGQQQQQPTTYMERGGSPYRGQKYTSPSHPRYAGPTPRDNVTETTDPGRGYSGSPSNPNWQPRKPMSPYFEGPRPTINVTRETRSPITPGPSYPAMAQEARDYARSPSNPNWRSPGG